MNFKYGLLLLSLVLPFNSLYATEEKISTEQSQANQEEQVQANVEPASAQESKADYNQLWAEKVVDYISKHKDDAEAMQFAKLMLQYSGQTNKTATELLYMLAQQTSEAVQKTSEILKNFVICDGRLYPVEEFSRAINGTVSAEKISILLNNIPYEVVQLMPAVAEELKTQNQ